VRVQSRRVEQDGRLSGSLPEGLGSRPGGAMETPCRTCGFLACALSGLLGGIDLPPPGVYALAGGLPPIARVAQLMVAGSLTGTSH